MVPSGGCKTYPSFEIRIATQMEDEERVFTNIDEVINLSDFLPIQQLPQVLFVLLCFLFLIPTLLNLHASQFP